MFTKTPTKMGSYILKIPHNTSRIAINSLNNTENLKNMKIGFLRIFKNFKNLISNNCIIEEEQGGLAYGVTQYIGTKDISLTEIIHYSYVSIYDIRTIGSVQNTNEK